ncbi:MAG: ribonuclease H family protein [Bacteroidota bacterium]
MGSTKKFYVVWKGKKPGVYNTWKACQAQIKGYTAAQYMSFPNKEAAERAFKGAYADYRGKKSQKKALSSQEKLAYGNPVGHSIAVDAASSGNPGIMEYRGVETTTGKQLFKQGPFEEGTNNIGEFLAIVHGLAFLKQQQSNRMIYSDSRTAMSWVRRKKCNTKLKKTKKNQQLFELIERAEQWLKSNPYNTRISKWETKAWGEIPADFGRK